MSNNNAIQIEDFGESYYDVSIFTVKDGKPNVCIDCFLEYGTVEDIVFTMDCYLDLNGFDDWDSPCAFISYDNIDLVYMPELSSPDYEIICSVEEFNSLATEIAA